MMLWSIWRRSNLKLWEDINEDHSQVTTRACHVLEEWSFARKSMEPHTSTTPSRVAWSKHPAAWLKCNVDAMIFQDMGLTGYVLCFRNNAGVFIGAKSGLCAPSLQPHEGKAWALLEANHWALELNMELVIFLVDCQQVVNNVLSSQLDIFEFGAIVSNCRELSCFNHNFSVKFVKREGNVVTRMLTRMFTIHPIPHVFYVIPDIASSIDIVMK